jgi:hypothetical protein
MHGLLGVELPLEEVGDLRQVSQVKVNFIRYLIYYIILFLFM